MEFGKYFLKKSSHKTVVKLQENEIELLEMMKKTISARIKSDRDYANSLSQLTAPNMKTTKPGYDSSVYKAWQEIVQKTSQFAQGMKQNAEKMQMTTLNKLNNLLKDKITTKKKYIEDRDRLDKLLIKTIQTDLGQKENDYIKLEADTIAAKQTYGVAVGKGKLSLVEKAQDKYRKNLMKLHNCHNDYVMQVEEARQYQEIYRSALLPQLLNGLQRMEMQFVAAIKDILCEYLSLTTSSHDDVTACYKGAKERMKAIDSDLEYRDFISLNRISMEAEKPIAFRALQGLGGSLFPEKFILNSNTIQQIEQLVQIFKDDLKIMQNQIANERERLQRVEAEIQGFPRNNGYDKLYSKHLEYFQCKVKLSEEEGFQKKQNYLYSSLKKSLNELGDQQLPPGSDLSESYFSPSSSNPQSPFTPPSVNKSSGGKIFKFGNISNNVKVIKDLKTAFRSKSMDNDEEIEIFNFDKSLRDQCWFHGSIQREKAEILLQNKGDFLVKESVNSPGCMVISFKTERNIKHVKIRMNEVGEYSIGGEKYSSITELLHHYYQNRKPILADGESYLVNPVYKDFWQINHDDVEIKELIGKGHFGTVHKGFLRTTKEWVAVKTCREHVEHTVKRKFLMEARILKEFNHPNIVRIIGVCAIRQPIYILMELVSGGDLSAYLRRHNASLSLQQLLKFCGDACSGLTYLEERKCIHRDIAARNCLVSDTSGSIVVKITDFGMSREEEDGVYNASGSLKLVPIRWTAPEAVYYGTFTSASDVWSFGILSWEVFAFGERPYPSMTNQIILEEVERGYRMPKQVNCPLTYYTEVMLPAWQPDVKQRPTFANLLATIGRIQKSLL